MAITISGSGITSANIADGTIVDEDVADLAASKLTGALPAIDGSALTGMPAGGKVLQVVQSVKTDGYSTTSGTWANITGLTVSITPTSTTSKILVSYSVQYGGVSNAYNGLALARGGSRIILGTAALPTQRPVTTSASNNNGGDSEYKLNTSTFEYLDSPNTTSSQTYSVQGISSHNGLQLTINRPNRNDAGAYIHSAVSSITVMEIGA